MCRILRLPLVAAALLLLQTSAAAQGIVIPNTFVNGTAADATQVNANFSALANNALNRTGGTMTGNLVFSTDNTLDIGASGATRPRDFFLGRNALVGGTLGVTGATTLSGVTTVNPANSRGLVLTRSAGDAGMQIVSSGGSGKTYALISNTAGNLLLTDDADALPALQFTSAGVVQVAHGTGQQTQFLDGANEVFRLGTIDGSLMPRGVAVITGGDDLVHFALQNDDVTHGMTDFGPTSFYALMRKASAASGGVSFQAFSEAVTGMALGGFATTVDTTAATTSNGAVHLTAFLKSGTGATALAAGDNTIVFKNNANATHIFKGNGDAYLDGTGWTVYDSHDDLGLLQTLERELTGRRDLVGDLSALGYDRAELEAQRLVSFDGERVFINPARIGMVLSGALRQEAAKRVQTDQRLAALSGDLQEMRAANALLLAELRTLRASLERDQPVRVQ